MQTLWRERCTGVFLNTNRKTIGCNVYHKWASTGQGSANYSLWNEPGLLPVLVSQVLLKHSHLHIAMKETVWSTKFQVFTTWPFTEKSGDPFYKRHVTGKINLENTFKWKILFLKFFFMHLQPHERVCLLICLFLTSFGKRLKTDEPNPSTWNEQQGLQFESDFPQKSQSEFLILSYTHLSGPNIFNSPSDKTARLQIEETHWNLLFFKGCCRSRTGPWLIPFCCFLTDVLRFPGIWCLCSRVVWFCCQAIGEYFGLSFAEEKQT